MKYPKYDFWCKKIVMDTIKNQPIEESKEYLLENLFNQNSGMFESGLEYNTHDILFAIGYSFEDSLFSKVQESFDSEYYRRVKQSNPDIDIKIIYKEIGSRSLALLEKTLENITVDELKVSAT